MLQRIKDAWEVLSGEMCIHKSRDVGVFWNTECQEYALSMTPEDMEAEAAEEEIALMGAFMMLRERNKHYDQCLEFYRIRVEQLL